MHSNFALMHMLCMQCRAICCLCLITSYLSFTTLVNIIQSGWVLGVWQMTRSYVHVMHRSLTSLASQTIRLHWNESHYGGIT